MAAPLTPDALHQIDAYWRAALAQMRQLQQQARQLDAGQSPTRPRWPMVVLRTPKGWTGPEQIDGKAVEGRWRSHQEPIAEFKTAGHVQQPEVRDWRRTA